MARDLKRSRDLLLICLGVTTGATDAVAFERLGHVFASVVTGDLVLLGISAVRADGAAALSAGCALLAYSAGVLMAAPRGPASASASQQDAVWPASTSGALAIDLTLLAGFAIVWEIAGPHPGQTMQVILLALAASAMGVQSSAVRRLGQMSTTYLTSTLTGVIESLAVGRWRPRETRSIGIILMALVGAAAAAALLTGPARWLPALQVLPLAGVLIASRRLVRAEAAGASAG